MNTMMKVNESLTMSSREIAELTGKQHKHVLTDIREMLETLGIAAAGFSATAQVAGPNNSKRSIKVFNLPKRETLILVSGYNVQMRAKIIDRWQELEAQVAAPYQIPKSFAEALALAAKLEFIAFPSSSQRFRRAPCVIQSI